LALQQSTLLPKLKRKILEKKRESFGELRIVTCAAISVQAIRFRSFGD